MHAILTPVRDAMPAAPLAARPDQSETWSNFSNPLSFEDAASRVLDAHRHDGERRDVAIADLRGWAFGSVDHTTMQLVRIPFPGRAVGEPLALREHAFAQLCQKIQAPAPYISRLPAKLQMACVNVGLTQKATPALLRLAGTEVRAILSDRYAAADDAKLLDMVGDCLDRAGYSKDARVRAVATGPHTVLRITLPGEGVAVKVGDVIEHGIDIGNSELGLRSVQITPITYRLVCTNGMRAWKSESALRLRHIGDPDRLHELVRDALPIAFAEARGDLELWRRSVDRLVDDALDEVESLRAFGLGSGEVRAVGHELAVASGLDGSAQNALAGAGSTVFDVANAVTAVARARGTAARLMLEEAGHQYLSRRAG
ncbi:MAG: DUF932 domain-containing protein [Sandaracinaceae bacterium]|nr:DUF932 domain-containing protein [Sandaracinaceae bacterium]